MGYGPPTERTADRAVELWKRMLRNPKYDNLGNTGTTQERRTSEMASLMAMTISSNVTEENLEKFGAELKRRILDESRRTLGADYGPDRILSECAEAAGLEVEFPWKTVMHVYDDRVSLSYGYGAEDEYHYPLEDGRWLVTKLLGSDIDKVIEYVNGGSPEFHVEEQENANETRETNGMA